ncbi:helix-turn-helix transcriptional regulator [Ruminococcaceae bacterium OttesenSCG-928-D13]|nr:helix-turn-helix transcriptional regulator [Ruminococcaceae bacterium OttesenSCG-928-D13]
MISYAPLWETMKKKSITTYTLRKKMNVSAGTVDSLKQGRHISTHTVNMLCNLLECRIEDIMVHIPD